MSDERNAGSVVTSENLAEFNAQKLGLEIPGIEEKQPNYVKSLKEELGIVEEFLPKILTKEELIPFVMKHVPLGQTGAIIKAVKEEVTKNGYLFDGKLTSQLIVEFQATKE